MIKKAFLVITLILAISLVACAKQVQPPPSTGDNVNPPGTVVGPSGSQNTTQIRESDYDTSKGVTDENGCYDSEGGIFYEKKGYIADTKGEKFADECVSPTNLKEVYCGIIGYKEDQFFVCDFGCQDAACLKGENSPLKCVDTDFKDYYKKGTVTYNNKTNEDYCKSQTTLMEQVCTNIGIAAEDEQYCQYGCKDGACIQLEIEQKSTCTDPDFGPSAELTKSEVTDPKGTISDECLNSYTVKEYKCSSIGYRTSTNIKCPDNGRCVDGACVS